MEDISAGVRGWLASSGLTPAMAARRAGVSEATMSRLVRGQANPSVGTLREIALACGVDLALTARPASDPCAAAAARLMLEDGYTAPACPEVDAWVERLPRLAGSMDPLALVGAAAKASSPLARPGALLLAGQVALGRVASAGDASQAEWALSGAAGLSLPSPDAPVPPVTVLWTADVRTVSHLLADTDLRETHRADRSALAVVPAEPELFAGAFTKDYVRFAAPIQIIIDCLSQGGDLAEKATEEARSW